MGDSKPCVVSQISKKTVQLDASTVEIEERGVKLRLTVVDTPGFGDAIDNTDSFQQIIRSEITIVEKKMTNPLKPKKTQG